MSMKCNKCGARSVVFNTRHEGSCQKALSPRMRHPGIVFRERACPKCNETWQTLECRVDDFTEKRLPVNQSEVNAARIRQAAIELERLTREAAP